MSISVFDLFSIGIGPSSSHTVGPMRGANRFVQKLKQQAVLEKVGRIQIDLYGSLALTGKGHGTDLATILGLMGWLPETVEPDEVPSILKTIRTCEQLLLNNAHTITFKENQDLQYHYNEVLAYHANGMRLQAFDESHHLLFSKVYYSIGGGFVLDEDEIKKDEVIRFEDNEGQSDVPYPFMTAAELLQHCEQHQLSIAQVMLANEKTWRTETEIRAQLLKIWTVMDACIASGCKHSGILPGGLQVKRRAPDLMAKLKKASQADEMNWLNLFALAVNEENAAGGRVVTAPTNGAAGIIPAVLKYHVKFHCSDEDTICEFLLTAGAIGILYKLGASISAAEVGCQGEVGVACSMAAAGLCAVLGGTVAMVERAAEIGMEHNLGLTCDPINGLVQVPCIERNTMGAVQAVNAAKLALMHEGGYVVSLDDVIQTMRETGKDMMAKYKETALGGLAKLAKVRVSQPAC